MWKDQVLVVWNEFSSIVAMAGQVLYVQCLCFGITEIILILCAEYNRHKQCFNIKTVFTEIIAVGFTCNCVIRTKVTVLANH